MIRAWNNWHSCEQPEALVFEHRKSGAKLIQVRSLVQSIRVKLKSRNCSTFRWVHIDLFVKTVYWASRREICPLVYCVILPHSAHEAHVVFLLLLLPRLPAVCHQTWVSGVWHVWALRLMCLHYQGEPMSHTGWKPGDANSHAGDQLRHDTFPDSRNMLLPSFSFTQIV